MHLQSTNIYFKKILYKFWKKDKTFFHDLLMYKNKTQYTYTKLLNEPILT